MTSLKDLPVRELRKLAAKRSIPGRSEMNREALVAALSASTLQERVERLEARVAALDSSVAALESSDTIHHGLLG